MENMEELNGVSQDLSTDALEEKVRGQLEMDISSTSSSAKEDDTTTLLLGKFKDVEALKNAYTALEADYTKKCQILAEKEKTAGSTLPQASQDAVASQDVSKLSETSKDEILQEYIFSNPDLKDKFLAKYFDELNTPTSPKLISSDRGSSYVLSPKSTPRTLEEAGKLVRDIFDGNNK